MTAPVIICFSRDLELLEELTASLAGRATLRVCDSLEELEEALRGAPPDGFVADFRRPSGGGHLEDRLLSKLRTRFPQLRVALLTGPECPEPLERQAADANIQHLLAPANVADIANVFCPPETKHQIEPKRSPATSGSERSARPLGELGKVDTASSVLAGITRRYETASPALKQMLADLEVAARHDVTILLIGETGAGKTYLSRLIHEVSPRRHEPFLTVACGALPNDLIESELFGHVRGAFTSAHADKEGKFVAARQGTILLDEIDVLGLEQQVKLLRVIETGEFESVGSNETLRSQARLVVASNLDLQPLVERSRFRPDLYYRLNMLKFVIPPLRERKMDILPLAHKFVQQFMTKHSVTVTEIHPDVFDALLSYPWPGNVRELEHVIQRAVIYCRDGCIQADNLPPHITGGVVGPTNDASVILPGMPARTTRSLEGRIAFTEREIIEQALFKNNLSRTKTAKELGISRVTLYNKMKRYGMQARNE